MKNNKEKLTAKEKELKEIKEKGESLKKMMKEKVTNTEYED